VGSWSAPGAGLTTGERLRIWRILGKFFSDPQVKFIGQNFKYDHEKIQNTLGFYIGRNRLHADVGLMSHTVQPEFRVALEFLTSIYTREPYYKDEGKEFDLARSPLEQLMIYNDKDAMVAYEIYEKLLLDLKELGIEDLYFKYKNRLHDFYMAMESTGFKTDEKQRHVMWDKYVDWYNKMGEEIKAATGYYINPNSVPDVKWLLSKVGLPERADTGKETISLLYANHAKTDAQKVACKNTLKMRSARKTMSQYIGVLPDFDGRVRSSWRIAGTETDRSATHMLEPPVRPKIIIKSGKDKKKRDIGIMVHNLTKYGEVGQDVRTMYIPDEGYWYGSADLSQAEAHVVANLADDKELLKLLWTADIHTLTASWLFGVHVSRITKKSPLRQIAKSVRHAGHYGMGKRKLVELLAAASLKFDTDLVISEWKAGQLLGVFHEYTPKIQSVFHEAIRYCINKENRTLVNPFGWPRTFHERYGDELFREAYAHIPQSTVPQQTKMAGLRVWDRVPDIRWVSEQHDSLDWMCKPEDFDRIARIVKEELETPIDFSKCSIPRDPIRIPAEIKVAKLNYRDFEDYKFEKVA
jgi:DNA polymerase-1